VVFNASKSKCLIFGLRRHGLGVDNTLPVFYIANNAIDRVHEWPHLGHIITDTLCDKTDILNRRNSLIGQINSMLCQFSNVDAVIKVRLLKAYCSSFYGCELWDLWDSDIESFCKAFRHGQRAIWKLPCNTHSRYLPLLCDSIPVFDEICRRYLGYINKCMYGDSELVQFIVRHGIQYGHMFSVCGRNALFCAIVGII